MNRRHPKTLIVDDDADLAHALSIRLRAAGFEVHVSHSAGEASSVVLHQRPHVILLDIGMPGFTGFEFHDCLRFAERGRDIPIVYVSAHDTPANRMVAYRQGARAFVAKPYDWDELLTTIRDVIESSKFEVQSSALLSFSNFGL